MPIDRLRPFYEDDTPLLASNETVDSGADDDVLPALISLSRRNYIIEVAIYLSMYRVFKIGNS